MSGLANFGAKLMAPPDPTGKPRVKPGNKHSLAQVVEMQAKTHSVSLLLAEDASTQQDKEVRARIASAMSQLNKSWCALQDSKREIMGKPKLKSESGRRKTKPDAVLALPVIEPKESL